MLGKPGLGFSVFLLKMLLHLFVLGKPGAHTYHDGEYADKGLQFRVWGFGFR